MYITTLCPSARTRLAAPHACIISYITLLARIYPGDRDNPTHAVQHHTSVLSASPPSCIYLAIASHSPLLLPTPSTRTRPHLVLTLPGPTSALAHPHGADVRDVCLRLRKRGAASGRLPILCSLPHARPINLVSARVSSHYTLHVSLTLHFTLS
ncbi:hypothetical protein K438DRAFT_1962584 [Mycena galopus ATCC 62051]|nr:hypothetical protein K438DRAFT_1962584 [Mycena galopus ATCC 62051]